jgi:hypothetical protein
MVRSSLTYLPDLRVVLFGALCESALAATLLTDFDAFGLWSTFEAFEATFALVLRCAGISILSGAFRH